MAVQHKSQMLVRAIRRKKKDTILLPNKVHSNGHNVRFRPETVRRDMKSNRATRLDKLLGQIQHLLNGLVMREEPLQLK